MTSPYYPQPLGLARREHLPCLHLVARGSARWRCRQAGRPERGVPRLYPHVDRWDAELPEL